MLGFLGMERRCEEEKECQQGKRGPTAGRTDRGYKRQDYHFAKYSGFFKCEAEQPEEEGHLRRARAPGRLGAC